MGRSASKPAAALLDDQAIGLEARSHHDDHLSLRLWLRLLACRSEIEKEIRARLRAHCGMTLARFDYLAQLHRHPGGLRMSALSRYLMVTGGNVTGLFDRPRVAFDVWAKSDADAADLASLIIALAFDAPGANVVTGQLTAPTFGSSTVRPVSVTLPVFVTRNV